MAEWKEYTVADVISTVIDYRGKTPKKLGGDWSDSGYRALSAKNIKTGKIVQSDSIRYVSEDMYRCWMKEEVQKEDILITSEAPFGQIYYWNSDEKIVLSQRLFAVRINLQFYPKYVYFYMTSSFFQAELDGRATGTTVVGLRQPELLKCKIFAPDYQEQKRIADTLWCLEQKINNNEAINNNLEQQAQAIFKEWFIDNPENENWSNGTFSELIQSTLSGDWGKEAPTGNNTEKVYCVRGADIPEVKAGNKGKMPTRYILPKNYASKKLTAGDIVVEISGGSPTQSTGRCTAISESLLNRYDSGMVCTNFCRAIKPLSGYSMFIYYYWQYLYDKGVFFSYENGTTGIKNLDISGFLGTEPIVIPPKEKVLAFDDYCQTVFDRIFANGKESEQLSQLRDTLLPKLMSGEIDVSDIDL